MGQWAVLSKYLVWVTALSASLAGPVVLCVLGARYLQERFSVGGWLMPVAIVLGLGAAGANLLKFFRFVQKEAEKPSSEDKDEPI